MVFSLQFHNEIRKGLAPFSLYVIIIDCEGAILEVYDDLRAALRVEGCHHTTEVPRVHDGNGLVEIEITRLINVPNLLIEHCCIPSFLLSVYSILQFKVEVKLIVCKLKATRLLIYNDLTCNCGMAVI